MTDEFTIHNRTYELVAFLKAGESSVSGDTMVERAKEINADLGEEDGAFILKHREEIPSQWQGIYLVFTAWHLDSRLRHVAFLDWGGGHWYQDWRWLGEGWSCHVRLVRRKV